MAHPYNFMHTTQPLTIGSHMRESYVLKYHSHDTDTPTYMETLSGENSKEYVKAMDDEIQSLMRRDT